jgi:hypothetical protein
LCLRGAVVKIRSRVSLTFLATCPFFGPDGGDGD